MSEALIPDTETVEVHFTGYTDLAGAFLELASLYGVGWDMNFYCTVCGCRLRLGKFVARMLLKHGRAVRGRLYHLDCWFKV